MCVADRGAGSPAGPPGLREEAILDGIVHGFALQGAGLPSGPDAPVGAAGMAGQILSGTPPQRYPYLTEITREHVMRPGYDFGSSFDVGLDLLLDGLAAAAEREGAATGAPLS